MKIMEKIMHKQANRAKVDPITIVCMGDSVTEGCFECYINEQGNIDTVFEREHSYSARLQELLAKLYPTVQIHVINSGFSGARLPYAIDVLERDVLRFSPDLVVVSYGLNDTGFGREGVEAYGERLSAIFEKIKQSGAEIIFLTQNYMCKTVSHQLTEPALRNTAVSLCERQNTGLMDLYVDKAKEVCRRHHVEICDLYETWKAMDQCGVNTTELLSNKLNHPIREYHYYIAVKLMEKMLGL